jgi:hypothetical protein
MAIVAGSVGLKADLASGTAGFTARCHWLLA